MEIRKAFKTVWIVEVLSPEKLGAETPLLGVIERIQSGDYAASLIVIEGGTFTGPEEITGALEDLDLKGNYAQDGDREPETHEEHDPPEDADPAEDADPPEEHDHGEEGDTGIAERENLDEDAEDSDPPEDAHLDAPKYPERPGVDLDGMMICAVCLEDREYRREPWLAPGTAYACTYCECDFTQPNVVRDLEAP
jgi:hypothetical protein